MQSLHKKSGCNIFDYFEKQNDTHNSTSIVICNLSTRQPKYALANIYDFVFAAHADKK